MCGRPFWVTDESSWCVTPPHPLEFLVNTPHHSPFLRQSQEAHGYVRSIFWIKICWGKRTYFFLCILVIWLWVITMYSQQWVADNPTTYLSSISSHGLPSTFAPHLVNAHYASSHQPLSLCAVGCCRKRSGGRRLQFQWLLVHKRTQPKAIACHSGNSHHYQASTMKRRWLIINNIGY